MDLDLIEKLDEVTDEIKNNDLLKEFSKIKKKVEDNQELLDDIERLKKLDIYSDEYKCEKEKLLSNKDFNYYKELENKVYLLLLSINKSLNKLKKED